MRIGVAAVQGAVSEHADAVTAAAATLGLDAAVVPVRTLADFESTDALVLPGGESTTMSKLFAREAISDAVRRRVAEEDFPILGTCAGMVLLASRGDQQVTKTRTELLGVMDFQVDRNAFGRQRESFERTVALDLPGLEEASFHAVFIRAPAATALGAGVRPVSTLDGKVIGVQQGRRIALSFHPELTPDTRIHEAFLRLVARTA